MYGAIIGDVVGSVFEFDRGPWTKEFELFSRSSTWTDDSVMTIAIGEALLNAGIDADIATIKDECIKSMKKWGQKYPYAGYGARFISWVLSDEPTPYGSWGNGSAMRVSAAGLLYSTLERMLMYGKEASNRKQEIDRQHYTIPNQRPKDKHCGKI